MIKSRILGCFWGKVHFLGIVCVFLGGGGYSALLLGEVLTAADSVTTVVPRRLNPDLLYTILLGEIAGQRGQLAASIAAYTVASEQALDNQVFERAVQIALYAKQDEQAMALTQAWLKQAPDNADAHKILASLAAKVGNIELASKHYQKVLSYAEGNLEQRLLVVVSSLLDKTIPPDNVVAVMDSLQVYYPEYAEMYYVQATLAVLLKRLDWAETSIQQALRLREHWPVAVLLYASILQLQQKSQAAAELLQNAITALPQNIALRIGYSKLLVQQKQLSLAQQQLNQLLTLAPDEDEARYILAVLALDGRDYAQAKKHFHLLIKQQKRVDEAAYYLGQIAELEQDDVQAASWYRQVTQGESLLEAKIRLVLILRKTTSLEAALAALEILRHDYPQATVRLYRVAGELLRETAHYAQAFAVYNEALQQFPKNVDLLYERALIAEKLDDLAGLEKDLLQVLQIEPENAHALNALGYTLADRTNRYEEALAYIQKAYALQPDDPAILDSMGWVFYRLGDYASALQFLRQAFAGNTDVEIAAHLGEVLWVSGAKVEALELLKSAQSKSPQDKRILNLLKQYQPEVTP